MTVNESYSLAQAYLNKVKDCHTRHIDFQLSLSDFIRLRSRTKCFYTGVTLDKSDPNLENYISLDRVDNTIGYTKENTVVCTASFNKRKNNLTIEDIAFLQKALKFIKNGNKSKKVQTTKKISGIAK